jgi:hypothetical protein
MRASLSVVVSCVLLALGLGACGSSASSSSSSSGNRVTFSGSGLPSIVPTAAEQTARLKLARCLRTQGINVPDPTAAGGTLGELGTIVRNLVAQYGQAKVTAATKACQQYVAASFPRLVLSPSKRLAAVFAFVRCMRSHGINLPDPQPGANGGLGLRKALAGVDQNTPTFRTALTTCAGRALNSSSSG